VFGARRGSSPIAHDGWPQQRRRRSAHPGRDRGYAKRGTDVGDALATSTALSNSNSPVGPVRSGVPRRPHTNSCSKRRRDEPVHGRQITGILPEVVDRTSPGADDSRRSRKEQLASTNWVLGVVEILRQRHQANSFGKRVELADCIVALTIRVRRASSAVAAIGASGSADSGLGGAAGPDALARLITMFHGLRAQGRRIPAIDAMIQQINPGRVLAVFRWPTISTNSLSALLGVDAIMEVA